MPGKMKIVHGKPQGYYLEFPEGEFIFGRSPGCHVRPKSEQVSRHHCLLRVRGDLLVVRDLGSRNGTRVNGKRLRAECSLADGDTIQLGPLTLKVVRDYEPDDRGGSPPYRPASPTEPEAPGGSGVPLPIKPRPSPEGTIALQQDIHPEAEIMAYRPAEVADAESDDMPER